MQPKFSRNIRPSIIGGELYGVISDELGLCKLKDGEYTKLKLPEGPFSLPLFDEYMHFDDVGNIVKYRLDRQLGIIFKWYQGNVEEIDIKEQLGNFCKKHNADLDDLIITMQLMYTSKFWLFCRYHHLETYIMLLDLDNLSTCHDIKIPDSTSATEPVLLDYHTIALRTDTKVFIWDKDQRTEVNLYPLMHKRYPVIIDDNVIEGIKLEALIMNRYQIARKNLEVSLLREGESGNLIPHNSPAYKDKRNYWYLGDRYIIYQ